MPYDVAIHVGNSYDKYSSENRLERRLVGGFLATLDRALPDAHPKRVLEVGTGEGVISHRVASEFPDAQVVGVDLPSSALADEWACRSLDGVFGDVQTLPFPDNSFDLVLGIEVLEHVLDPAQALCEIARVARGNVVLSVPLEPWWRVGNILRGRYLGDWGNTPGHIQHWGRRRFAHLVAQHLEVRAVASPFPWTMVVAEAQDTRPGSSRTRPRSQAGSEARMVVAEAPVDPDEAEPVAAF